MLEKLTAEDFRPHLGESFPLELADEEEVALTLVEVQPLPLPPAGWSQVRTQPFSLLFHGPRQPALPQGTFAILHPTLGRVEAIFLVPVAEDSSGRTYEAVFN